MIKYLRFILLALLCITVLCGSAQMVIQPAVPRLGIIQKTQLWNMLVVNSSPQETVVTISLVLQDRLTGHTILTAESANITIPKGSKQLNEQAVFPIQYQYEAVSNNYNQQALLPVGNYLACYNLIIQKGGSLGQECVAIDVAPLSPPMLIYPSNQSVITERTPQLSWIPPTPTNLFNQLRYDVTLTEMNSGQSPEEAIRQNTPMYIGGNLTQQTVAYPASALKLDTGKIYAWQVTAKNGESYAAKSEAWSFSLRPPTHTEEIVATTPFVKMKQQDAEMTLAPNGILKFAYSHQGASAEVTMEIQDISNQSKKSYSFKVKVQRGDNYLQIVLKKYIQIEDGHIYMATLTNSDKEKYRLRFEVKEFKD